MKISNDYIKLVESIGNTFQKARENAFRAINTELVKANWEIGRYIVEFEQEGKEKADYGSALLTNLFHGISELNMGKASVKATYTYFAYFISPIQNSRQCLEN